jgi:peptide subunit release factor 1 (eRF1)
MDARHLVELRWRTLRSSLRASGADEATLQAIDQLVHDTLPRQEPTELAVFAAQGRVGLAHTVPVPVPHESATWTLRPRTAELLRAMGERVRWVRANVERDGATIATDEGPIGHVEGPEKFPLTKVSAGGWSMPRFQRAAEVMWDRNSAQIAQDLIAEVQHINADVIVLSGDVRARQLVRGHLPAALDARVVELDHSVPDRALADPREPGVRDAVDAVQRERRSEAVDRFHEGLPTGDSVRGVEPVTDAARELRIETLVLGPEPSHRQVWVDPDNPVVVGMSKKDIGRHDAIQEPADDALVLAAALAGADTVVISHDADLVENVGATLRYRDDYPYPR